MPHYVTLNKATRENLLDGRTPAFMKVKETEDGIELTPMEHGSASDDVIALTGNNLVVTISDTAAALLKSGSAIAVTLNDSDALVLKPSGNDIPEIRPNASVSFKKGRTTKSPAVEAKTPKPKAKKPTDKAAPRKSRTVKSIPLVNIVIPDLIQDEDKGLAPAPKSAKKPKADNVAAETITPTIADPEPSPVEVAETDTSQGDAGLPPALSYLSDDVREEIEHFESELQAAVAEGIDVAASDIGSMEFNLSRRRRMLLQSERRHRLR